MRHLESDWDWHLDWAGTETLKRCRWAKQVNQNQLLSLATKKPQMKSFSMHAKCTYKPHEFHPPETVRVLIQLPTSTEDVILQNSTLLSYHHCLLSFFVPSTIAMLVWYLNGERECCDWPRAAHADGYAPTNRHSSAPHYFDPQQAVSRTRIPHRQVPVLQVG